MIQVVKFHTRRFHVTSNTFLRRIVHRNPGGSGEHFRNSVGSISGVEDSNVDYLGIESEEGAITVRPQKFSMPREINTSTRLKERFYRTTYGVVRYDTENKPKFHGQYGKQMDFTFPYNNSEDVEVLNNVAGPSNGQVRKKFESFHDLEPNFNQSKTEEDNSKCVSFNDANKDFNYIDTCYFGSSSNSDTFSTDNRSEKSMSDKLNFVDEYYFENAGASKCLPTKEEPFLKNSISEEKELVFEQRHPQEAISLCSTNDISELNNGLNGNLKPDDSEQSFLYEKNIHEQVILENNVQDAEKNVKSDYALQFEKSKLTRTQEFNQKITKQSQDNVKESRSLSDTLKQELNSKKNTTQAELRDSDSKKLFSNKNDFKYSSLTSAQSKENEQDSTAYDFVAKLRKEKEVPKQGHQKAATKKIVTSEKVDSKGFRILKDQVQGLSQFTRSEIINLLKKNVVYSDDELVVLNKPYNLIIHESKTTKEPCLSMYLDDLAKEMDQEATNPKLFTVHRLDKETTGCLLLARNETMAQNLKSLFAQRKITKKYWIITIKVPDPVKGIIDMPISEGSINNRRRMVLHPKLPKDIPYKSHSRSGRPAVTSYEVISESGNAALVEVTPVTGVKHQIRVHFGFGLGCPILGDHKYSHIDKLVPQKLPSDILQKLHVRQSKVRHIPMHIHAKSVVIPDYFEGRDLFVNIPLPDHMKKNLERLKFRKK